MGVGMLQALTIVRGPWLCLVWLVACGPHATGLQSPRPHGVAGQRSDIATRDGIHDGYRVARSCREADCVGVTGTGARWFPGMERERLSDPAFMTAFEQLRALALQTLAPVPVRSTALGQGCSELGLVVGLGDWRQVDGAIARVGKLLRDRDLREQITICVEPEIKLVRREVRRARR